MAQIDILKDLWDVELEQALLGQMLAYPQAVKTIRQFAVPSDFVEPIHRVCAQLIFDYDDENRPITAHAVWTWARHELAVEDRKDFDLREYLRNVTLMADAVGVTSRAPEFWKAQARTLADYTQRRQARDALIAAQEDLVAGAGAVRALAPIAKLVDQIASHTASVDDQSAAHEAGWEMLRLIESQATAERAFGCSTGIAPVDEIIGALYPGNLIVVAGRPGMGKSIFATNLVRAAAQQGWLADFWSLEMTRRETAARLQTDIDFDRCQKDQLAPLHFTKLVQMKATTGEFQRAAEANLALADLPITIFDMGAVAMSRIAAIERARAADGKPRLVVIDHLQIVDPEPSSRSENRVQEITQATKSAKQLAKRLGAPVVLLSQLSRDVERRDDKRPFLSDLRESGSIEQDADVVMFLYRHEYYARQKLRAAKNEEQRTKAIAEMDASKNVLEVDVAKNRSGRTDVASCFINVAASAIRSEPPGFMPQAEFEGLTP